MLYDFTAFANFADKVESDPRTRDLIERYDADPDSLSEDELSELVDRSFEDEDDYVYEPSWDIEVGFDPYMGCYSDDC